MLYLFLDLILNAHGRNIGARCIVAIGALAQLVARRSHNPKVVSSILTGPILRTEN